MFDFFEIKVVNENGNNSNTEIVNKNFIVGARNTELLCGALKGSKICEIELANGKILKVLGEGHTMGDGDFTIN